MLWTETFYSLGTTLVASCFYNVRLLNRRCSCRLVVHSHFLGIQQSAFAPVFTGSPLLRKTAKCLLKLNELKLLLEQSACNQNFIPLSFLNNMAGQIKPTWISITVFSRDHYHRCALNFSISNLIFRGVC